PFSFNDPPTTDIYTLSLHDALPISLILQAGRHVPLDDPQGQPFDDGRLADARIADQHGVVLPPPREHLDHAADFLVAADHRVERSEEHTSELQSRSDLVCRLLLEKK